MTGRRLPPEWAPQDAVMLTWPHEHGDWQPHLEPVEPVFVEIAHAVAEREALIVTCRDATHRNRVAGLMKARGTTLDRIRFYCHPSNDTWARDHGPITVSEQGGRRLLDFVFNGWGNKHPADLDNRLTGLLYRDGAFGELALEPVDLVLEGGSIDSDGAGSLLTTSTCLLSPERNPSLSRGALESRLRTLLGVERILWLEHGYLAGDDTDSHVDTLARFCNERTIAHMHCTDRSDEHHTALIAMERELQALRDQRGEPYKLVPLPLPGAIRDADGRRLPASYVNFLIINGAVLVPTYGDPADTVALARLAPCFPDRELIAIDCRALIEQYGSLHCVTMQIPAAQ